MMDFGEGTGLSQIYLMVDTTKQPFSLEEMFLLSRYQFNGGSSPDLTQRLGSLVAERGLPGTSGQLVRDGG